jgi:hypothetical protein
MSIAILDHTGMRVGAISVAGTTPKAEGERLEALVARLRLLTSDPNASHQPSRQHEPGRRCRGARFWRRDAKPGSSARQIGTVVGRSPRLAASDRHATIPPALDEIGQLVTTDLHRTCSIASLAALPADTDQQHASLVPHGAAQTREAMGERMGLDAMPHAAVAALLSLRWVEHPSIRLAARMADKPLRGAHDLADGTRESAARDAASAIG